jgi:outer membrane receptor for ferrienterochelin and colicins
MLSRSKWGPVVPVAVAAVLFPGLSYGQEAVPDQEISLESLMDMVVTATLREQSTADAPASIQVVTAADIKARGYRTIKAVMNDVPGFNDVSDTNEEIVAVRGVYTSTTNKILTLVNGHRMNDLMLGRYNTDQFLGVEAIERIEFIRGPASALYGSGALVGIVNIITKKGADLSGTQVKVQGGPYGQEASASWGRQLVGYDVFFNFTYLDAVGQTIGQDETLDRPFPVAGSPALPGQSGDIYVGRYRQNLSGMFTLRSENSSLALRGAHFRRVTPRGSNGALYNYEEEPLKPAYTENDIYADYQYHLNFGKNKLTLNPSVHYFSYYEQSFITWGVNRVGGQGTRSGTYGEYANYQMKATYERQLLEGLNFIGGGDALMARFYRSDAISNSRDFSNILLRPRGYTLPGNWLLMGAFAQTVYTPVKQLDITMGARFDTFGEEADPRLTPRLGVVVKPVDNLAVKLLYGQSYLAPMWAHSRANDGNFFVDTTPGAAKLKPETFTGYDLIATYGNKKASVTADFYYNEVKGLINGVPWRPADHPENPNPCFNGATAPGSCVQYRNSADSLYMGAEFSSEGQITPWLRLTGSYSYILPDRQSTTSLPTNTLLHGYTDESGEWVATKQILHIPTHTLRYGLRVDPMPKLSFSVWGRTYLETKTTDFRSTADAPINSIPAVALFDAAATYDMDRFTFQLIGKNLTNRYYEMGGPVARPLARERINVEGSVAVKF